MKKLPIIVLTLVLAGFTFGLVHLFNLRFESGDNYPPYSSLRADPLGSKALYESLDLLMPVRRHLQPLSKLGDGRETTLVWLGEDVKKLRFLPNEFKDLETFVRTGGRVVIGLLPAMERPRINRFAARSARGKSGPATPPPPPPGATPTNSPGWQPGDEFEDFRKISIRDRWNVSFDYAGLSKTDDGKIVPALAARRGVPDDSPLPRSLSVHTSLHFDKLDPAWRIIYVRVAGTNVQPVVIERTMGKGSIVLCADSFHFSNEALRRERDPELLAWFVGPAREVVFDESHLGVRDDPGVASLARKYRLGGVVAALLILAGLFIWKNSASFMPPYEEQIARERGELVEGKDSTAGFINLLRRNIAPADLMKVCLEQWNTHFAHTRKPSEVKLEAMQKIIDAENALEPRQRNPVRMYRELGLILKSGAGVKRET
jgi:Domain of unknown function (DUF4350)